MIKGLRNIARMLNGLVAKSNAADGMDMQRLLNERSTVTGGNGFRVPPKQPRVFADGTTRGDRKRAARLAANAKVSERRAPEYRHQRSQHIA